MTPGPGIRRTPLPLGFTAGGINSGVRKYRPDLGLILSDREAVTVAVFTQNECLAAPVLYSQEIVPTSLSRAIITNSGQANAATGPKGLEDNFKMAEAAAKAIGCRPDQVLTASTGMIGVPLAIDLINPAFPELVQRLGNTAESFAVSILTTDLVPKTVSTSIQLKKGEVKLTGIAKGSGMIHPNMATMLGYILTDAVLSVEQADQCLRQASDLSFNMISVDGDTSTNDTVFLMANGASEVGLTDQEDFLKLKETIIELAQILAKAIARDGEGATKLIEVNLRGAPELESARRAARGITLSPLIKSAIHGEDPNWGRILARLGAEKIPNRCLQKMNLTIQGTLIFQEGRPLSFDRPELRNLLKEDTVKIEVDFFSGSAEATAWGCDLSKKYVEINAEYTT